MDSYKLVGIGLTLLGGALWGLSGTSAQFIQQSRGVSPEWLLVSRLIIAGIITIIWAYLKYKKQFLKVFEHPRDIVKMMIFGIFGVALCQYSYFRSIYYAGAGIATVLQYLAPALIVIYMLLRYQKLPSKGELISVVLATLGTFIIALQGSWDLSGIDEVVLFWGILSAIAVAIYSMQPVTLLRTYGTLPILGWAMLGGGIVGALLWWPVDVPGTWDLYTYLAYFAIVVLGTVVSFNAYLEGVRRIGAVQGTVLSSIEPISAAILGWALLGNHFLPSDYVGFILILITIFILAREKGK